MNFTDHVVPIARPVTTCVSDANVAAEQRHTANMMSRA
jgi:hypothetical protein